ncbi:MAG: hypothetical protein V1809_07845 [Planctomycetota bacterium]
MLYKPDWPETREWLAGWWKRQVRGHWALGVTAPREKPLPAPAVPPDPADPRGFWMDDAWEFAGAERSMAATFYGGVAFPWVTAGLGPGALNLFLGSQPKFTRDTVWYNPIFTDPAAARLSFDPENSYWRWTLDATRRHLARARGKCLVAMPDIIEGVDILSELLGTEELLVHLLDCPGEIHRLLDDLDDLYFRAFEPLAELIRDGVGGNAYMAFNGWGPGRTLKTQCDFSAMISPGMFAEFVVPHLERQCARVDFSVYHLDGPNAVRHLPALLRVRNLTAIQWTPGAGQPAAADPAWWDSVWRPVYAAGKAAMVLSVPPEQAAPFVREFGQAGTLLLTRCESERAARRMLEDSAGWGV